MRQQRTDRRPCKTEHVQCGRRRRRHDSTRPSRDLLYRFVLRVLHRHGFSAYLYLYRHGFSASYHLYQYRHGFIASWYQCFSSCQRLNDTSRPASPSRG